MEAARISVLLGPFLGDNRISTSLAGQFQSYLDLLLRWNARMNLTSVRDPEQIVTRHFGESLFAARVLRDAGALASQPDSPPSLADVGSGAGFPGIPIKLFAPEVKLTLIESHNKKATFLREVVRAFALRGTEVFCGRAEDWKNTADVVTLRAVERIESALPIAASLVGSGGTLCLLIGTGRVHLVQEVLEPQWQFDPPARIPRSGNRVVLLGRHSQRTPP